MSNARSIAKRGNLTDARFEKLIRATRNAGADAKAASELHKQLQGECLEELRQRGEVEFERNGLRAVRRANTVREIDLAVMLTTLGRSLFNRLTVPKVNTPKWNAAVESGLVTKAQAKSIQTVSESKPWVEISEDA